MSDDSINKKNNDGASEYNYRAKRNNDDFLELASELHEVKISLAQSKMHNEDLLKQIQNFQNENANNYKQIEDLTTNNQYLIENIEILKPLQEAIKSKENEIDSLKSEFAKTSSQQKEILEQNTNYKEVNTNLNQKVIDYENQLNSIIENISKTYNNYKEQEENNNYLNNKIVSIHEELFKEQIEESETISLLKNDIAKAIAIKNIELEQDKLSEISALTDLINSLEKKLDQSFEIVKTLEAQKSIDNENIKSINRERESLLKQIENLNQEKAKQSYLQSNLTKTKIIKVTEKEHQDLKNQLLQYEEKNKIANDEKIALQNKLELLEKDIFDLSISKASLCNEIEARMIKQFASVNIIQNEDNLNNVQNINYANNDSIALRLAKKFKWLANYLPKNVVEKIKEKLG